MCVDDFKFKGLEKLFVFIMYLVTKFRKNHLCYLLALFRRNIFFVGQFLGGWFGSKIPSSLIKIWFINNTETWSRYTLNSLSLLIFSLNFDWSHLCQIWYPLLSQSSNIGEPQTRSVSIFIFLVKYLKIKAFITPEPIVILIGNLACD